MRFPSHLLVFMYLRYFAFYHHDVVRQRFQEPSLSFLRILDLGRLLALKQDRY